MEEKLESLRFGCGFVGTIGFSAYIILVLAGSCVGINFLSRIITAMVALIAYSIKLGIEIASHKECTTSVYCILFAIIDIIVTAANLV